MTTDAGPATRELLALRDEVASEHTRASRSARQDQLTVATRRIGERVALVAVAGELDLATAPLLAAALRRVAQPQGSVRIDLRGLVFMDSTGMRAILEAHRDAARDGWTLRLGRALEPVQRVFVMAGIEKLLPFESEEDDR